MNEPTIELGTTTQPEKAMLIEFERKLDPNQYKDFFSDESGNLLQRLQSILEKRPDSRDTAQVLEVIQAYKDSLLNDLSTPESALKPGQSAMPGREATAKRAFITHYYGKLLIAAARGMVQRGEEVGDAFSQLLEHTDKNGTTVWQQAINQVPLKKDLGQLDISKSLPALKNLIEDFIPELASGRKQALPHEN